MINRLKPQNLETVNCISSRNLTKMLIIFSYRFIIYTKRNMVFLNVGFISPGFGLENHFRNRVFIKLTIHMQLHLKLIKLVSFVAGPARNIALLARSTLNYECTDPAWNCLEKEEE